MKEIYVDGITVKGGMGGNEVYRRLRERVREMEEGGGAKRVQQEARDQKVRQSEERRTGRRAVQCHHYN